MLACFAELHSPSTGLNLSKAGITHWLGHWDLEMRFSYLLWHRIPLVQWARCLWNRSTQLVKKKYYYLITEEKTNTFQRKVSGDVRSEEVYKHHGYNIQDRTCSLKEQSFGVRSCHLLHNCTVSRTVKPQNHWGQKSCGNFLAWFCFFPTSYLLSSPFHSHCVLLLCSYPNSHFQ